jgi:MoaA/NifB/PqqE/SkfB family radical SAM enzyme
MKPRFYSGWRWTLNSHLFLIASLKYLLQRKRFPLFEIGSKSGLLKTQRLLRLAGYRKSLRFGFHAFSSPIVPRYPSKAFDAMVARGGLNLAGEAGKRIGVHSAFLAITQRCCYGCEHCYERHNIASEDATPIELWQQVVREVQSIGASIIILTGGEPLLRYDDALKLLRAADKDQSDFHLHTSGNGLTLQKARELKRAGLVAAAVGLDDVDPAKHDALRGWVGAYADAVQALRFFSEAEIFTYVNTCMTKEFAQSGRMWKFLDLAREMNVGMIQLLEPRPCGGYWGRSAEDLFTESERALASDFYLRANSEKEYAGHPIVYYVAYLENPLRFGCTMGGITHFHIDSRGNLNPCVFVPISFGNVFREGFVATFQRMRRETPFSPATECPSVLLAETLVHRNRSGAPIPVPFNEVTDQWRNLFAGSRG